jgi:predicted  nucleic acid-binding Zn-ribbon protein
MSLEKLNAWPDKNKRPRISSLYSDEELWAMKEERDMTRVELSATKQELATAKEKISLIEERLTKAYRVRDELDRLIQSLIPTLTA